ncbi:hypothetical protein [uncultured Helicobacter sp.]|uniref:hypothetical protein n=1 Tax=uncultured Helicobacter sp. TaxID=175537 RepID=UPI00374FCF55
MHVRSARIFAGFVLLGVLGGSVAGVAGRECGMSFFLGYGAFGVIMSGLFLHIKHQLGLASDRDVPQCAADKQNKTSLQAQHSCDETLNPKDKKPSYPSRFIVGVKLSFSFVRIFGYVLFLVGVGGLLYYDMFMPTGLFVGITLAMVYMVGVGVYVAGGRQDRK